MALLGTQRLAAADGGGGGGGMRVCVGGLATEKQIDFVTSLPKLAFLLSITAKTGATRGCEGCVCFLATADYPAP